MDFRIADAICLTAMSTDGRWQIPDDVLGIACASGLLAELVVEHWLLIDDHDHLVYPRPDRVPRDGLAHIVAEQIAHHRVTAAAATWIRHLATTAPIDVCARLHRQSRLVTEPTRWRRGTRLVPANANIAALPTSFLAGQIARRAGLDVERVILTEILLATNLHTCGVLVERSPEEIRAHISACWHALDERHRQRRDLPALSSLHRLQALVHTIVGDTAVIH